MGFLKKRSRGVSPRRYRLSKNRFPRNATKNSVTGLILFFLATILISFFTHNRSTKVTGDKTVGEMSVSEHASYMAEVAEGATLRFSDPLEKARYIRESKDVMDNLKTAKYKLNNISSNESMETRLDRYKNALDEAKQFNINYQAKLSH